MVLFLLKWKKETSEPPNQLKVLTSHVQCETMLLVSAASQQIPTLHRLKPDNYSNYLHERKQRPLLCHLTTYLFLLFGFTAALFLIVWAPLLRRTWVFGAPRWAHAGFAASTARRRTGTAVLLVGFHEFSNELGTVQVLLGLPCVVLAVEVHRATDQHPHTGTHCSV